MFGGWFTFKKELFTLYRVVFFFTCYLSPKPKPIITFLEWISS